MTNIFLLTIMQNLIYFVYSCHTFCCDIQRLLNENERRGNMIASGKDLYIRISHHALEVSCKLLLVNVYYVRTM